MNIKEAHHYINTAFAEGFIPLNEFERYARMGDLQLVEVAEEMADLGDRAVEWTNEQEAEVESGVSLRGEMYGE